MSLITPPPFIHLRVRSAYSLLEGAIGLKELVKWCVRHDMPAVAVADSGNLFGSLEFAQAAEGGGIQPVMGCTLFIRPDTETSSGPPPKPWQLPVYAKDETGWQNLLALVSQSFLKPAGPHAPLLSKEDLLHHTGGLIALTGGIHGEMGSHLLSGQVAKAEETLHRLNELFPGCLYIELMRHGLAQEKQIEPAFIELALKHNIPLVATNDAYFIDAGVYEAHDAFLCIADGAYVSEESRRRLTPEHRLKTPAEMQKLFADIPEALENTVNIALRCAYAAPARKPMLPTFTLGAGEAELSEADILRAQAREGLELRLRNHVFTEGMSEAERGEKAQPYRERLEFEIETIIKMNFPGYFLIVSDFIKWSKAHDIPVGPGRGSGAGSLVAWALFITDLDPLRYGLLFERFLNPERVSMPDFDVDFCQDRRDEVIAYVQKKYGVERVAQIITFGKLQARAVLRDVGRVLQMPYGQVDKICKLVPNNPANPVTLKDAIDMEPMLKGAMREDETVGKLVEISLQLEGLNRHASTHAAGVVIGDRPLYELVPMYRDPKSEMPVVQYSMKYAEAAGLVKFDFLGLKTLTVLMTAVRTVAQRGITLDLLKLPEGDKPTYAMLSKGDTVGVFQLESAGMRDTLKKLKPDCIEDLIALVSLYRPGPMDNIPTYIARKHGHEEPDYLHPLLTPILKETFGVIIYQEQVMQIAQVLAGYSLGEADLLRRAMGKKIKSEMEAQRGIFVEKAVAKGVEKAQAASIFDLIAKFAEYGFNKSHAAAYALISYQTAFLKANFAVEFYAASMTYDMHNTDKLGIFREDAMRAGIRLLPPDINRSGVTFEVEWPEAGGTGNIRYALAAIRNVGMQAMQAVVSEREKSGAYADVFDFVTRVPLQFLNKRSMEFLIKAGAFDSLHGSRAQLILALDYVMAHGERVQRERESAQVSLFDGPGDVAIDVPVLPQASSWPSLEQLHNEFEAIGFYLSAHPLEAYRKTLSHLGVTPSSRLPEKLGDKYTPVKIAGIVTGTKFKVSDKGRFAFVQISDVGGMVECSVFNEELLSRHRDKLENGSILVISAEGKMDEAGPRLIAQSISDLEEEAARNAGRFGVRIVVNAPAALKELKTILGDAGQVGASVMLSARLEDRRTADIRLPGKYLITPGVVDKIKTIGGVTATDEIPA